MALPSTLSGGSHRTTKVLTDITRQASPCRPTAGRGKVAAGTSSALSTLSQNPATSLEALDIAFRDLAAQMRWFRRRWTPQLVALGPQCCPQRRGDRSRQSAPMFSPYPSAMDKPCRGSTLHRATQIFSVPTTSGGEHFHKRRHAAAWIPLLCLTESCHG